MRKCAEIAVIAGTYDPFTNGHFRMSRKIFEQTSLDCVVYLPTKAPPHKVASPFDTRLKILQEAIGETEQVFWPTNQDLNLSPKALIDKVRAENPDAKVFAVLGTDLSDKKYMYYINRFRLNPDGYVVTTRGDGEYSIHESFKNKTLHVVDIPEEDISSTRVRKWFGKNQHLYFQEFVSDDELPNHLLQPKAARAILDSGMYIGVGGSTSRGLKDFIKVGINRFLKRIGLFERYRAFKVRWGANGEMSHVKIDGKKYPLEKYVGSGISSDSYIINRDGKRSLIKIAHNEPEFQDQFLKTIPTQMWLSEKTDINVPKIENFDREGKWIIMEFVEGEKLTDYLKANDGVLTSEIEDQLKKAVDEMLLLSKRNGTVLRFSSDNFRIKNGKVFMINATPQKTGLKHPMSFEGFKQEWSWLAGVQIKSASIDCAGAMKRLLLK